MTNYKIIRTQIRHNDYHADKICKQKSLFNICCISHKEVSVDINIKVFKRPDYIFTDITNEGRRGSAVW